MPMHPRVLSSCAFAFFALLALAGCDGLLSRSSITPRDGGSSDAAASPDAGLRPDVDAAIPIGLDSGIPTGPCVRATELWREDFESGDHRRWTSSSYGESWGDACQSTAITRDGAHGGSGAQRSEIVCASRSPDGVHRGYGGLQWNGERVLPEYTNSGAGLDAPHGIVTTFWTRLDAGYPLGDGRWLSLFTISPACDYSERVITLGLDQPDGILRAAHYWPEGRMDIEPSATAMPLGRWTRISVYLNLHRGEMHVWQDGQSIEHVSGIVRGTRTMCQWHWGLYASADNTDLVLVEDDKIVWRLDEAWTDWSREPWMGAGVPACPGG